MSTTQDRPRRSRAQWQTLIEQAEHSALSISDFCHAQDLSVSSFYQWRKRAAAEQGPGREGGSRCLCQFGGLHH